MDTNLEDRIYSYMGRDSHYGGIVDTYKGYDIHKFHSLGKTYLFIPLEYTPTRLWPEFDEGDEEIAIQWIDHYDENGMEDATNYWFSAYPDAN